MINGIAKASMDMASTRIANEVQVAVMKNAMDVQKEVAALLLDSFGVGNNLNVSS